MRRALLLLALLPLALLFAPGADAQSTLGPQCNSAATASSVSCTLTIAANSTLIVAAATGSSFSTIGDTFSLAFTTIYNNAGQGQIFCAPTGANSGSENVSITFAGSSSSAIQVVEFQNGPTCTLDGTVQTGSSGGNPITTSVTTTKTNDLLFAAVWANWSGGGGCNAPFLGTGGSTNIMGTTYNATNTPSTITVSCSPNFAGGSVAMAAFQPPPRGTATAGPSKLAGPSVRH